MGELFETTMDLLLFCRNYPDLTLL